MTGKLSSPVKYYSEATFTGRSYFPLDMLRYDACYPASSEDAANIGYTFDPDKEPGEVFQVRVRQYHETKEPRWTDDRWRSFGWSRVTE